METITLKIVWSDVYNFSPSAKKLDGQKPSAKKQNKKKKKKKKQKQKNTHDGSLISK